MLSYFLPLTLLVASVGLANQAPEVDDSILDRKTPPCEDFYQFACGSWLAKTEIPADLPAWDRGFVSLSERNKKILRQILEDYSSGKKKDSSSYGKKLGDFYESCMDEKKIEKQALPELKEELKQIQSFSSVTAKDQLASLFADLHLKGVNIFFDFSQQQDAKDSTQVIGAVDQAGLGLPDRDYYLKDDPKTLEVRKLYQAHIVKMFKLMGDSQAEKKAEVILKLETALAQNSMARVDRRDPQKVYHRLERKGLKEKTPALDWDEYFKKMGVPDVQAINVAVPDFFSGLDKILSSLSLEDLKTYLTWHFVSGFSMTLSKAFVDERFQFQSKALTGQKEIQARWKRCVQATDQYLGFALGKAFVELTYGSEGKVMTDQMIQSIEKAFDEKLKKLEWMDEATKKEAFKKLHSIHNKVGYPKRWRNYDAFVVKKGSYLQNILSGNNFLNHYYLSKIGKPVDREEWEMNPPMVNAYYDPSLNEMVFPAGILQPPYFDRTHAPSINYGGIGMVMGHELTHGFDDQGRQFNAEGNLVDWWSPEVSKAFQKKTQCVSDQYDQYEALPGVHLNGKLTLGENIADHGGIRLAYEAFKASQLQRSHASQSQWTEDQKFFLSFAQAWCSKKQDTFARTLVKTDPHSPAKYRVNGSLSQFPEFAEAFQCQEGQKMAPKQRCSVW